ncbi:neutral zinc metallopeptidase [Nocardioides hankookensis]|uniref:Neutral zinc metallopeptidase n=1 Tax=Nocardioides hankookensis TaxID=443157 RepID=A0ABW1LLR4_9ACTN
MRFNPKARLDASRMGDAGRSGARSGGGGRGGIPIPGGAAGGGIGTLIIIVIVVAASMLLGGGSDGGGQATETGRYAQCEGVVDANKSADCARVAIENSLTDYWSDALPAQSGTAFEPERKIETFTDGISTGCGAASADVGPFYCPVDKTIYLDTTFYDEVLERQLGGPDGGFVEAYVLAHEYGHHIQNLLGTMGKVKTQQGAKSDAVRLELQADCYAGMWAKAATTTQDVDGNVLIEGLTDADIQEAIDAATAVGDDRIQQSSGGDVDPESWTHGSAKSRVKWFMTGDENGTLDTCDTFAPGAL